MNRIIQFLTKFLILLRWFSLIINNYNRFGIDVEQNFFNLEENVRQVGAHNS